MRESTKEYLLAGAKAITTIGAAVITGNRGGGFYRGAQECQRHWDRAQFCRSCEKVEKLAEKIEKQTEESRQSTEEGSNGKEQNS